MPTFTEQDPIQEIDLSGGILLKYDPSHKNTSLEIKNDSLLLVKTAKVTSFSLSYSHIANSFNSGDLYWGIKPTFYNVGLTNVTARLGDITDSEDFFDDIKNADYVYDNNVDIDLGLVFSASNYQVGLSIINVIEQDYKFPEIDRTRYKSDYIIKKLDDHAMFTMERQVQLEAGIFTDNREWNLHVEVDANEISDQMYNKTQWLSVTGNYASDSRWLPDVRLGFSKNLAGSQISYANFGVTMVKFISLDVSAALDTITLDDTSIRRGLNIQLGVQFPY